MSIGVRLYYLPGARFDRVVFSAIKDKTYIENW